MTYLINGRHFFKEEIDIIIDKVIKKYQYDDDLENGNFSIGVYKDYISLSCLNPYFSEKIPMEQFKEFSSHKGKLSLCKNCEHFEKLGRDKEAFGMCLWIKKNTPALPFWAKLNTFGSISPEHKDCAVFRRKKC